MQLLAKLPADLVHRILLEYASGKDLSTLSLALVGCVETKHKVLSSKVIQIGRDRLRLVAEFMEQKSAKANHGEAEVSVQKAAAWIRAIASFSSPDSDNRVTATIMRYHSENMALLDFLDDSITNYSRPERGEFEWLVWCGQVTVESHVDGTRLRNTARVVVTAPIQRPSYIPCTRLSNQIPCVVFRCELYNMVPVPPWGILRPLSSEDADVLRPVARRLDTFGQVAIPSMSSLHADILDVRIVTSTQADRLLRNRSWTPRTDWIVRPTETTTAEDFRLICCWQDDSEELSDDREYLGYILDMWKIRNRLETSVEVSSREYVPT